MIYFITIIILTITCIAFAGNIDSSFFYYTLIIPPFYSIIIGLFTTTVFLKYKYENVKERKIIEFVFCFISSQIFAVLGYFLLFFLEELLNIINIKYESNLLFNTLVFTLFIIIGILAGYKIYNNFK
jgi:hypothetical protein